MHIFKKNVLCLYIKYLYEYKYIHVNIFYIYIYIYCGGRSKRQTQWVWRQASERLLLNRNNTIKVSKGNKVSKINRGSGVLVVNADCEGGAVFWKEGSR